MNSKQNKIEEEFCLQLLLLNSSFDILGFRIWYSPITLICDDYNFKEVKYMWSVDHHFTSLTITTKEKLSE